MSQFIEMFEDVTETVLSKIADITMGTSPDSAYYNTNNDGLPFYQGKTEFDDMYIRETYTYCSAPIRIAMFNDVLISVRAPVGAVNIATSTCCIGRGLASIRAKEGMSTTMFLYYALKLKEAEIDSLGTGSTFKAINKNTVHSIKIPKADIDLQNQFVEIAEQADKSKFVGFKSQFIEMFGNVNDNDNGIQFDSLFYDDTKSATKIIASEYLESGKYAIYDQSQDNITCGYSNNQEGLCLNYPAILFGDHSRVIKLIDKPFFIGADGVKIIRIKSNKLLMTFAYYMLRYCTIHGTGYNRHFKYLKLQRFYEPDIDLQKSFITIVEQADKSKYIN